jgi:hypothetical protein
MLCSCLHSGQVCGLWAGLSFSASRCRQRGIWLHPTKISRRSKKILKILSRESSLFTVGARQLVSCPRNTFHNFSRFYDTLGAWGSLFSFTTIYPEVVERPHNFAYYEAAPQTMYPQRRAFFVPVHRTLSSLGAVTGSGVFWVVEMKRDPHVPFESAVGTYCSR